MTIRVVVDSCVSIKWFIPEPVAAQAKRLLAADVEAIAPDLVLVEIANALRKNERLKRIEPSVGDAALTIAARYFHELLVSAGLLSEAFELARAIDHPIDDCLYVVASRRT
jgi:predicted nucleic acid-binding protein